MSYYAPPPPTSDSRVEPTPHQPQTESDSAQVGWIGGFVVGMIVGSIAGAGLALVLFMVWYNGHCGQVPLVGGAYCR